jgi:hypothetical protein
MGGLGNQLFQIFATIAYAIQCKQRFAFLKVDTLGEGATTIRPTYWNTLLSNMKPFLINELPSDMYILREKGFPYEELPFLNEPDILLFGYFQSYRYFQEKYAVIYKMLGLEKKKETLLDTLGLSKEMLTHTISMHFRIGDYKKIQHVHPLTTYEYYERALIYMQDKEPGISFTIYYFCEDVDIDDVLPTLRKLETAFPLFSFERGTKELTDWEQLLFMSSCHHNIIANSSFSWWAAYMNSWEDKRVFYPEVWFGPAANHDVKDLCPSTFSTF